MENASKALIIAGSILIVIALIAFGMKIFTSASEPTTQVNGIMTTTGVATFNSKFLTYAGSRKSKDQAIQLLNLVIINNSSGNNHKVYVSFQSNGTISGAIAEVSSINKVMNGELYPANFANKSIFTIGVGYDSQGYINLVKLY